MKRFLILFMVLGVIAGSMATAEAVNKAKKPTRIERTVVGNYGPYPAPVTGCNGLGGQFACLVVGTRTSESSFTAKVTDLHGQPVFVQVSAGHGTLGTFCGETTRPIAFEPGSTLFFYLGVPGWPAQPMLDCPANRIKTTGTISVTLSNVAAPVRSGSVLSGTGWVLDSQLGGCQMSPECAAWKDANCENALAGRNPGLTASIVNVDELADGPSIERVFRFGTGDPWGPVWGGVQLQFWSSGCVEIREARWRSTDCDGDGSGRDCRSTRFRIPSSAKWMTVTGYQDNVNLAWTLT